jgi:hypothetical protein
VRVVEVERTVHPLIGLAFAFEQSLQADPVNSAKAAGITAGPFEIGRKEIVSDCVEWSPAALNRYDTNT